jgi:hypothetical protein
MSERKFTYHYNASAIALGGVLKDAGDNTTIVPSLASVALPPSGGEGFTEVLNYDKDGVSFSNASSRVTGYDSAYRTFTTTTDVYVTNLNLFGRVKAAILQTSVSSTREVLADGDVSTESNLDKAGFSMRSMIRGLTIDGVEVIPQFDIELCDCPTYERFTTRIGANSGKYAQQFGVTEAQLQALLRANVQPIHGSFVNALQYRPTNALGPHQGFRLPVKNFGTVHFGELVVNPGTRRVNLLRLEFDSSLTLGERLLAGTGEMSGADDATLTSLSPFTGTMTVVSQITNGSPSWP